MSVTTGDLRWSVAAVLALAAVVAAAYGMLADVERAQAFLAEGGSVETLTAALYAMVAVPLFAVWGRDSRLVRLIGYACLLAAARELDLHKAFTSYSVLSLKLYFRPDVPLVERIGGAAALAVLAALLAREVWLTGLPPIREMLTRPALRTPLVTLAAGFVGFKLVDAMPRWFEEAGRPVSERTRVALHAVEEIGELFLPIATLLFAIHLGRWLRLAGPGLSAPQPLPR